jgi:EmrB/QacA subfamily drug resistance transporter
VSSGAVALSSPTGRGVLLATVLGSATAFLDATVVNVALPALQTSFGADLAALQWTVDAYLLFLGTLLLVGGALGDRFGRRRVFLIGIVWFALASAACGLAASVEVLIVSRAIQGVGAALLVPGSLSLVRATFREADQGPAIGAWAGLSGVTTAVGPIVGGWLIGAWSWRAVFFLNLPLAVLAAFATLRWVPESRSEQRAPLDLAGASLITFGLGGLVLALIEGPRFGWPTWSLAAAAAGVLGLALFAVVEGRRAAPMLPLELFRSRQFSGANLATLAIYFSLNGTMFLLVLHLQRSLGYSPLEAGAALTPLTLLLLALSASAGKVGARVGHGWPMTIGALVVAAGLLLLTRAAEPGPYVSRVLPGVLILGLGLSALVAPLTTAVLESVGPERSGVASGVNNAVARIAALLAVALLPWIGGIAELASASPEQLAAGLRRALVVCAALCVLAGGVSWMMVSRRDSSGA